MNSSNFVDIVNSWEEQRVWGSTFPVELLEDHPLKATIQRAIDNMHFNGEVSTSGYKKITNISTVFR